MKYNKDDIHLEEISPRSFENLCYDLVVKYGFINLIWREGGADNGRDIEANYIFNNSIRPKETKYFFECKHYTSGGVPPEHLNSKIAWADAELPDVLVIFTSSYLTNGCRTWIEKLTPQKKYEIICIEGEELKERLINYPELIEQYFSQGRYSQMLKNIKDYKAKFKITPSFELLEEIIKNIDLDKLDIEDFSFLLLNFYSQFSFFETRNDFYGDFDKNIINRLLVFLKTNISNEELSSFVEYRTNYEILGGEGIFDEMDWLGDEDTSYKMKKVDFQYYELYLNPKLEREKWKLGLYLFVIFQNVAFEIFSVEKSEIRIIKDFTPDKIAQLSINQNEEIATEYKMYLEKFGT